MRFTRLLNKTCPSIRTQHPPATERSKTQRLLHVQRKGEERGEQKMGKWGRQYFPFPPSSPRLAALGEKGEGEGDTSSDVKRGLFPPPSREPKYFSQTKKDASEKEMRERDPPSLLLLRRTQSSRLREIEIMNRARPLREIRESNFLSPPPAKKNFADLSGERSRLPRCPEWSFVNEEREQQLGDGRLR